MSSTSQVSGQSGSAPTESSTTVDLRSTIRETAAHISRVQDLLTQMIGHLCLRSALHDQSKLAEPELTGFATVTAKLKDLTYGSPEYFGALNELKPTLHHHYTNNRHHPEHFPDGIRGMNLIDVLEMFCDWKAAGERHKDGSLLKSIEINQARFGYSDDFKQILINTASLLT